MSHACAWGKNLPVGGNSQCKGRSMTGMSRNRMEVSVLGRKQGKGREAGHMGSKR